MAFGITINVFPFKSARNIEKRKRGIDGSKGSPKRSCLGEEVWGGGGTWLGATSLHTSKLFF